MGPIGMWDKFLAGVCLYDAAINTGKPKYSKHANKIRSKIHSWVKNGNPNANHHACLLDAEFYRMKKENTKASQLFERAATMAGRRGLIHDAALAQERYALHILNSKASIDDAAVRVTKAMKLYSEWGADAKVESLEME